MTARLAMTAFAAALVAMPVSASAKPAMASNARPVELASINFTSMAKTGGHARSRYMLVDDLPETYGPAEEEGIKVKLRVNRVKVKVPFALNY